MCLQNKNSSWKLENLKQNVRKVSHSESAWEFGVNFKSSKGRLEKLFLPNTNRHFFFGFEKVSFIQNLSQLFIIPVWPNFVAAYVGKALKQKLSEGTITERFPKASSTCVYVNLCSEFFAWP